MDSQGASNSKSRIDKIPRTFTHLHATESDERLLAAAKSDNEELLLDIFDDPDSFDVNYQDGFVHYLQPDSHPLSSFRPLKAWQYRCLDHILQAQGHRS